MSKMNLRSPICCVLGHVNSGKTSTLDKIRNLETVEAGNITQQISSTFLKIDELKEFTNNLKFSDTLEFNIPGLLIIDTPGHESFSNLRNRGTDFCDIAILVIDINKGLEKQTLESINILRKRKTYFVIALNKIDKIYGWVSDQYLPIRKTLSKQNSHTINLFKEKVKNIQTQLMENSLNPRLYYENDDIKSFISMSPISAITGEGFPDLLMLLIQLSQKLLYKQLEFKQHVEAMVLDVKKEQHRTTLDVILRNGFLNEKDKIVVGTRNAPLVTTIRYLKTSGSKRLKSVNGSIGIELGTKDNADGVVAGSMIYSTVKEFEEFEKHEDIDNLQNQSNVPTGLHVQSTTAGSLEALIQLLDSSDIKVGSSGLGPLDKKVITMASNQKEEYKTILAFNIEIIDKNILEFADKMSVKIIQKDIIYHLLDSFKEYKVNCENSRRELVKDKTFFPCILEIIPEHVITRRDPIILGVEVLEGLVKPGTTLLVEKNEKFIDIGKITSIESKNNSVDKAIKKEKICIKIEGSNVLYGRQFDHTDKLYSKITRESIDILKEHYKDLLNTDDWKLLLKFKKMYNI